MTEKTTVFTPSVATSLNLTAIIPEEKPNATPPPTEIIELNPSPRAHVFPDTSSIMIQNLFALAHLCHIDLHLPQEGNEVPEKVTKAISDPQLSGAKSVFALGGEEESVWGRTAYHLRYILKNEKAEWDCEQACNRERGRAVKRTIVEVSLYCGLIAHREERVLPVFLDLLQSTAALLEGTTLYPEDVVPGKAENPAHWLQSEIYNAYKEVRKMISGLPDPDDAMFANEFGRKALRGELAFPLPAGVVAHAVETVRATYKEVWGR